MTAPTAPTYRTREEWLVAAVEALRPRFELIGVTLPAVRVSVGWPGGRGKKNSVIGQCWAASASADNVAQVFISPVLDDAPRVLDVLAHELVHAADDNKSGHKGEFTRIAKGLGLTGKMTATVAGEELAAHLVALVETDLGSYPHAAIVAGADGADGPSKQGTRMLKIECGSGNGYIVRMTRKWLDEYGTPSCPCHGEAMREVEAGE
jgi:hypothetical protein